MPPVVSGRDDGKDPRHRRQPRHRRGTGVLLFGLHGYRDADGRRRRKRGLTLLAGGSVDLVVQDMNFTRRHDLRRREGIALFREIRRRDPDLPVILLTAWTQLETAVELVKAGAADYLAKPWDDAKLLADGQATSWPSGACSASSAAQAGERQRRARARSPSASTSAASSDESATMQQRGRHRHPGGARRRAGADHRARTAPARRSIADIVHANSACKAGPFVKVNMGALAGRTAWRASCSAPRPAPTPARRRRASAASRRPTAAPCSWTRSATCRWPAR